MAQLVHILTLISIFAILAASLNIALGYTGLINLGHVAFFGVGAYTTAVLVKGGHATLLALLASGLLAAVTGAVLTKLTAKLKGDYFALATLGFAFVAHSAFLNVKTITRGPLGIPGIPRPEFFGIAFKSNDMFLIYALIVLVLVVFLLHQLVRSRYGTLLQAVRDDEIGLASLGKNVYRLKYQSMMISAFFAGIAGSLYAQYVTFIDPSTFFISDIVVLLTIVIVGGLASLRGSVVAAIIIIVLPELLRFVDLPTDVAGGLRQVMYTVLLLAILLFRPRGLFGKVDLE